MFRTVTVHPQELLFRCCMCRLLYVLIRPAGTTFEEEEVYILQKMIHGPSNVKRTMFIAFLLISYSLTLQYCSVFCSQPAANRYDKHTKFWGRTGERAKFVYFWILRLLINYIIFAHTVHRVLSYLSSLKRRIMHHFLYTKLHDRVLVKHSY